MKRKIVRACSAILMVCSVFQSSFAQISIGGLPHSLRQDQQLAKNTLAQIPLVSFPALNLAGLEAEDKKDGENGWPPRFGYPHEVRLDLYNSGQWTDLENGDRLWRIQIECAKAKSLNFLFDKFWLPPGGVLYIYGRNGKHIIGGFTSANNKGTQETPAGFGTGLVYSDNVLVEYLEPKAARGTSVLSIAQIVHGYRYIRIPKGLATATPESFGASGNCQVNVNCPEGSNWQDAKRGVALILVNGSR